MAGPALRAGRPRLQHRAVRRHRRTARRRPAGAGDRRDARRHPDPARPHRGVRPGAGAGDRRLGRTRHALPGPARPGAAGRGGDGVDGGRPRGAARPGRRPDVLVRAAAGRRGPAPVVPAVPPCGHGRLLRHIVRAGSSYPVHRTGGRPDRRERSRPFCGDTAVRSYIQGVCGIPRGSRILAGKAGGRPGPGDIRAGRSESSARPDPRDGGNRKRPERGARQTGTAFRRDTRGCLRCGSRPLHSAAHR